MDAAAKDPRTQAGVYRHEGRLMALNRAPAEDLEDTLELADVSALLHGIPMRVWDEPDAHGPESLQTEVCRLFLLGVLAALLVESLLVLPRRLAARAATAT